MTISGDLNLISISESAIEYDNYPDEDFLPMPEGDRQRRNLSYTTEALRLWFEKQVDVYVSGNLFIRYLKQNIEKRIAPNTFVVFDMSCEDRVSYKIYDEGGKAPDFVLEITSKGTVNKDQEQNPLIYRDLGVKEYFQYDPTGAYLKPLALQGLRLEEGEYVKIPYGMLSDPTSILPNQILSLHSEVLGLDLCLYPNKGFRFYDPISHQILRSYAESEYERSLEQGARFQAELERTFEREARRDAEAIAEQERLGKEQAEQKAQRLAEKLRALGIDPDEV
jgi:Uma2 family endonuclease